MAVDVKKAIDAALSQTTGTPPRAKFVGWFKEIALDIVGQPRTWTCFGDFTPPTDVTDGQETIYPDFMFNLFVAGLLMKWFKDQKDGRYSAQTSEYGYFMAQAKAKDNRLKTMPTYEQHGYIREDQS